MRRRRVRAWAPSPSPGVGLLMAGTLRAEGTLAAANGLFLVLLLLGGVILPVDHLPGFLADLARVLPASALSDAYRIALGAAGGERPAVARRPRGVGRRRVAAGGPPLPLGVVDGPRTKRNPGWSGPGVQGYAAWLRGADSNRRPSGYEPDELPLLHPANATIAQAPN